MTIHVLTPVHNRCAVTEKFVDDLYSQEIDEDLRIVIVDDGSTDGTSDMLLKRAESAPPRVNLSVTKGDGSWWWARSMAAAIDTCRRTLERGDVVVFMNDDVQIKSTTLKLLAEASRSQNAIITASVHDLQRPDVVIDRGARLAPDHLAVIPVDLASTIEEFTAVDVAAGRSVAFPSEVLLSGISLNFKRLPHHLADFEFSVRAARCGYPILLARDIRVYSFNDFSRSRPRNPMRRLFHVASPDRLSAYWAFWRTVTPREARARTVAKLLRYRVLPQIAGSLCGLPSRRHG